MNFPAEFSRRQISSVVLAAGESRRMGFPKPLLRLGGRSFLRRVIDTHRRLSLPVYVVLGENHHEIAEAVDLSGTTVLVNPEPERGQLSSLLTALDILGEEEAVIMHPVDHPLVQAATLEALLQAFRRLSHCVLVPEFQGRRGHPVLFPARFYFELRSAPLEEGARWLSRQNPACEFRVKVEDPGITWNLNTPAQLDEINTSGRWGLLHPTRPGYPP